MQMPLPHAGTSGADKGAKPLSPPELRFEQQLKKGVLEMLVLGLICQAPTYGYELLGAVASRSDGLFVLKEGTLYPILYRLEDDGLITAAWQTGEGRATPKKYYTVTEAGRAAQTAQWQIWQKFSACVDGFAAQKEEKP